MPDQTQETDVQIPEDCAQAPLNGRWIFKLTAMILVFFAVGLWGFWDASSVYPTRGQRYADWAQWAYLDIAKKADSEDYGIFIRETSVPHPVEELSRLSDPETKTRNLNDANDASSTRTLRAAMLAARLNWLEALAVIGQLNPEHTTFESPQRRLDSLRAQWQSEPKPKPLHNFDLIVQWLIMLVCWSIALLMLIHMLRVRGRRYAWDAQSMTLTIPSGGSITCEDLEEVDKRKWDKFIVFLKIKASHETLGGQEIAVDTYQHNLVEDWILAMEEKTFGSQEDDDDTDSSADSLPDSSAEPTTESDDKSA